MTHFFTRLKTVPPMALLLGLLGLLPFIMGGVGVWLAVLGDLRFALPLIVIAYGCLIASFLGGVRWGAAMQNNEQNNEQHGADGHLPRHLVMALVPTLIALVAFMLPLPQAFTLLIILFVAQAVLDINSTQQGEMAAWYAPLRLLLTIIADLSMTSLLLHALTH